MQQQLLLELIGSWVTLNEWHNQAMANPTWNPPHPCLGIHSSISIYFLCVYDLNATNKQVGSPRQRDLCTLESWKGSIQKSRDVVFCMVEPRSPNPRCFPRVVNRMDTPRYGHCNVGQCSVLDGHDGPDGRLLGVGVKNACYSVPVWLGNKNRIVPMDLQNTHKFTHINIAKQWLKAAMEHISHSLICCDEALSFWG